MNQLLNLTNTSLDYPLPTIIFNIIFGLVLGLVIATIYRKNHRGTSYSDSFTFTLVLLTAAGSILMMIVGNSLARAFSLFGAFSIIRFRTAVKEAKDIAYVFISLVIGMSVGTNNYTIAVISTLLLGLAIIFMTKNRFGSIISADHLLTFQYQDSKPTTTFLKVFSKHLISHQLVNLASLKKAKATEFAYNLQLKPSVEPQALITDLKKINGVSHLRLVTLE